MLTKIIDYLSMVMATITIAAKEKLEQDIAWLKREPNNSDLSCQG
jgi:hypothetical protein